MKDFFKFTLATVTGIVLSGIVLFIIGVVTLVGIISSSDTETVVKKNSVMMLDLKGTLVERTQESLEGLLGKFTGETADTYGLDDILASIKKAKENDNIKGIYIQASWLNASYASLQAIRKALDDFKESGKFIVAYSDNYTQGFYYLSSVADKVMLNPKGMIEWRGLASAPIFYKDLLQKLGIEMQVFKVGTYKSAVEPFTATEMSPANREQVTAFIGSIWNQILDGVSASRKIGKDSLNMYADRMLMFYPSDESVKCRLADTLIYQNDVRDYLKTLVKIDEDDRLPILGLEEMVNIKKNVPKDKSGNILAVYYASGEITDYAGSAASDEGIIGSKMIRDLRKLKEDDDVKAVVLRVNSPGGSAFASEQIWHAVKELKAKKPVIVSMGDYAASGGYYISCAADSIIAEPTTLTGSIGIFGMIPNVKGLTEKIGLTYDVVKTNQFSDFGNLMRPVNSDERALLQMMIGQGYDLFVSRCAEGRHMSKDKIEKIAEGRVWTGEMAKKIGLVDELGGIGKALEIAAQKADLKGYTIISYPAKKDILSTLFDVQPGNYVESQVLKSQLGDYYKDFSLLKNIKERAMIQARVPFELNVK
ncbi:signal peptide peptidase SppA, 67K type [Bacteroides fragilis str. 3986 T(B)9]|uniref:signal peptide peptidase SppA n=1 Tax=Bacteroides fragilis TaxID=817 RepID=UPI0004450684|nr:signal peptide peptidase SppA [Bacteroides fragilis]EXY59443.1 signal peptide peptidase SppA, 67K type [Bacteroides fragilis str. 3986T(B)10]EXY69200.1 signal peptide peptidase SppA, 67K type [Bacteroides fragilis str. 3986 T(B)9]EYA51013.1 signal peptide peptidase SppA, 67K type [Bacteroides fragilis str. 3986 N(B)22]EYA55510.1 signal peptide peptidase SppA, 67K type [Bacteroides fragilis str. 3986 T(B)13]EYE66214.1 signal peptide peptidase SppA, 67K type [Bacteroides fragilis str. 3986 N3